GSPVEVTQGCTAPSMHGHELSGFGCGASHIVQAPPTHVCMPSPHGVLHGCVEPSVQGQPVSTAPSQSASVPSQVTGFGAPAPSHGPHVPVCVSRVLLGWQVCLPSVQRPLPAWAASPA